jgi:hypothetical protein
MAKKEIRSKGGENMNPLNYASLEASKRLVDAGIVLETDQQWYHLVNGDWYLSGDDCPMVQITEDIPVPSMAEVWRELPEDNTEVLRSFIAFVCSNMGNFLLDNPDEIPVEIINQLRDINTLVDFLIWVRKEKP